MTDFAEEQENEVQVLESIYPEEFSIISHHPKTAQIIVHGESIDVLHEEHSVKLTCTIQFTLPSTYPDVMPIIAVTDTIGLEQHHVDDIIADLNVQAEDNVGMVMMFTLASAAQNKLNDISEAIRLGKEEEQERIKQEAEEAERKKYEGTRVTIETFLAWKEKFDAEKLASKTAKQKNDLIAMAGKLTGKQLFLTNSNLNESDLQFLEEGDEDVKIDESLFQDLEELELDENEFIS